MADARFAPIVLRYDGLDAAGHQIELAQLGTSLQGAAKLIGVAANFVLTGEYIKKTPALSVRVYARESSAACFQLTTIIGVIAPIVPLVQPMLPLIGDLGSSVVEAVVNYVIAKFSGRPSEMERALSVIETAVQEQGATSRAALEAMKDTVRVMAESNRPSVRLFVAPVGESCATARIGQPENGAVTVDLAMKDVINSESPAQISDEKQVRVFLSELDMHSHSCKLSVEGDDEPERRYPAVITDPAISLAHNPYADAMAGKKWISVRAKTETRNGDLERFYISNTV